MHQTLQPVSNVSEIQNKTLLRSSLKGYLDHICLRISLSNSRSMIGFGATNDNNSQRFNLYQGGRRQTNIGGAAGS